MSALSTPSAPTAAPKASAFTSTASKSTAPAADASASAAIAFKSSAPAADAAPAPTPIPKAGASPQALEAWRVATSTRLATEAKRAIGFSLSHHVLLNSPSLAQLGLAHVAAVCVAALARARAAYLPSREDYDTKRLLLLTPHASLAAELAGLPGGALAGCLVLSTAQAAALLDTPTAAAAAAGSSGGGGGGGGDSGGESRSRKREAVRAERAATPPARLPRHAFLLRSSAHPERGAFAVPCVLVVDLTCRIEALGGGGALAALEALQRLLGSSGGGGAPLQLLTRVAFEREEREGRTAAVFLSADEELGGRGATDAHVMGLVPTDAAGCAEQFEVVERA